MIKFKLLFALVLSAVVFSMFTGCGTRVPAGYVGVEVNLYDERGVQAEELPPGRYYTGINTEIYIFSTFEKNYPFTKTVEEGSQVDESISFQTKEGVTANVDVAVNLRVDPSKADQLFQRYRLGMDEIVSGPIRNSIRDGFNRIGSNLTVEEVYSEKKTVLIDSVQKLLTKKFNAQGVIINNLTLISAIRFPGDIQQSLSAKIKATQIAIQRENEKREAEARSAIALIEAKAKAETRSLERQSLTPEILQKAWIDKWDGKLPEYVGTNQPMIGFKQPQ